MENKDYNEPNRDYGPPEHDAANPYRRPVYETAEEYNKANRSQGYTYGQTYTDAQYNHTQHDDAQYGSAQHNDTQYSNAHNDAQYGNPQYDSAQYNNAQYGNPQYNNQQYGNPQYGGFGGLMTDAAGNPLKNRFAIQLVFAIIEILLCCFSPIAMILGIIALVFTIQANSSYNLGRAEEFKAKSKTANILLIIGGVFALIGIIINAIFTTLFMTEFKDIYSELQQGIISEEDWMDEMWDDESDLNPDIVEDYPGTDTLPLIEGFENFTHKGIAYSVPMPYETFMGMGYVLEEGYENFNISAESWENIWFYDEAGNALGCVRISNDTKEVIPLEEGVVDYIYFDNPASYITDGSGAELDLTFGNGFDMTTGYEELEAWLGTPYYVSVDTTGDVAYTTYEWIYNGDDKHQAIVINYLDDVITDISFEQYDIVY